jgi:hypothetical protein
MTNSRAKGARGEREVAALFNSRRHGFHQSQRGHQAADVDHPILHIEVKYQDKPFDPQWMAQAKRDCPPHKYPVVVYRRSRTQWRIRLHLHDLQQLLVPRGATADHTPLVDLSAGDFIELTNTRLP